MPRMSANVLGLRPGSRIVLTEVEGTRDFAGDHTSCGSSMTGALVAVAK